MPAATQAPPSARRAPSHPLYLNEGLSPKKTAFIIVTVIGCIAILWPKVFYPMMFGGVAPKPGAKEQRGPGGCCDVVLDREHFMNASHAPEFGPQLYRKHLNLYTGEISLRQERPAHLHPESIYQAMRERGRAIPATPTVPIVERKASPSNPPPRIVEGRPGPIPGMRPPMGAGSVHQSQAKGSSMGFIMPLYTIGIIVFFMYTIMKIVFKKPLPNAPYGPAPTDPNFRKEVFGQENGRHVEDLNSSKLGWREHQTRPNLHPDQRNGSELYNASLSAATAASNLSSSLKQQHHQYPSPKDQAQALQQYQQYQQQPLVAGSSPTKAMAMGKLFNKETEQLMEIEKLRRKLEDTEKAMAKLIAEMNSDQYEAKEPNENTNTKQSNLSNGHTTSEHGEEDASVAVETSSTVPHAEESQRKREDHKDLQQRKRREGSADRSVAILGMEVTASCEGGQKWTGRPPTPVFHAHNEHSSDADMPEPQSIYLEGSLAHESQILVSDAETRTEEVYDEELNGSAEEPAVVLSSKMTLSLINLDSNQVNDSAQTNKNDIESPLADDIEIIGHDEEK